MKYASDNRAIRSVYEFTAGRYKPLFIVLVVLAVGVGMYFPVRDLYIAQRSQQILQEQIAIREKYESALSKEVDGLLSKEGVEDAARKELGMVQPGEKTITPKGLDEDGNPIKKQVDPEGNEVGEDGSDSKDDQEKGAASKATGDPKTSEEVEAAEQAVFENSAWYWKLLDSIFFYDGTNGQAVTSTGE